MSNEGFNIFWGSPDSWIQERFNYNYEKLELELKLLALLFDKIILSPAFLLESPIIDVLLRNNISLVENGTVCFSFSNMNHGFVDYSAIKSEEKIEKSFYKNKILENHLPNYNDTSLISISSFWNDKIHKVKRESELPSIITNSLLNQFKVDVPNKNNPSGFKSLLSIIISNTNYYKKYDFYEAITIWKPSHYDTLYAVDKATLSFLLSSAKATNSYAALIFPNCALPSSYSEYGVIGNLPYLFKIFTSLIGIEKSTLLKIETDQIIQIRNLQAWKDFRETYLNSIIEIEESLTPDIVYHTLIKTFKNEKIDKIRNTTSKVLDNNITNTILSVGAGIGSVVLGLEPIAVTAATAAPTFVNKFLSKIISKGEVQPITSLRNVIAEFIETNNKKENQIVELREKFKNL